jgi:hypothetical protein
MICWANLEIFALANEVLQKSKQHVGIFRSLVSFIDYNAGLVSLEIS